MRQHLALLLCLAGACSDDPPPSGPYVESHVESFDIPTTMPSQIDLLFVVDDTAAMAQYRTRVLDLATALDTALLGPAGTFFDTRIAVTTAATTGAFRQPAGVADPFLATALDAHYNPTANFSGTLRDALAALLDVGSAGTAPVAPLPSAKAALDANGAFVRPYSGLMVVTLASSDDASAGDPLAYAASLKSRRTDPARVFVTGAYPAPAPRLDAFFNAFPNRGFMVDAAQADWSEAVDLLLQLHYDLVGACVPMPGDVDPLVDGRQVDCVVEAVYQDDTSEVLPFCSDGGPARCFEIVEDPNNCFDLAYGRLVIRGYPGHYTPGIRGQCVVF